MSDIVKIPEKIRKRGEKSREKKELKLKILHNLEAGKQVEVALSRENPSLQEIEKAKKEKTPLDFHLEKGVIIPGLKVLELSSGKPGIFMRLEQNGVLYKLSCYKDPGTGKRGTGHIMRENSAIYAAF